MSTTHATESVRKHFEGLRGVPHAEILIFRNTDSGGASATLYNTIGLPSEVSDEQFRAIDPEALKAEFHADGVVMNGPRRAMTDELTIDILDGGEVTSVGGIPMWIIGRLVVANLEALAGQMPQPYTEMQVERTTTWVARAGRPVHELVAPTGHVYAMHSCSLSKDPSMVEQLAILGGRLHLPEGWQYRARLVDDDLIVRTQDGLAHIVLDEFENNYQRED